MCANNRLLIFQFLRPKKMITDSDSKIKQMESFS